MSQNTHSHLLSNPPVGADQQYQAAREVTLDDGDSMIDSDDAWAVIKAYF